MALEKKSETAALEAEVADLKKEVAALKKALSSVKKSSGGADPRVDVVIEAIIKMQRNPLKAVDMLKSLK